ncbi:MAG TPA: hypothetical protein PLF13_12200 [candidate division Zixibacteria bacterium]|nr:hypothetical protein [candidate division Zixibacteria bacterium]
MIDGKGYWVILNQNNIVHVSERWEVNLFKPLGICLLLLTLGMVSYAADNPPGDFRLLLGMSNPSLSNLNDYYIDQFAAPIGLTDENFGSGLRWGLDFSYPMFGGRLRVGFVGIETGIDDSEPIDMDLVDKSTATYIADSDFDVSCAVIMLRFEKCFGVLSRTLWIGAGPQYGFGKVDLSTNWLDDAGYAEPIDEKVKYDADGLGLNIAAGSELISLGPVFSAIEVGYDWLDLGHLRDEDGAYWRLDVISPGRALDLDLSGPYFLVAAGFKL